MGIVSWVDWESDYKDCQKVYFGGDDEHRQAVITVIRNNKLAFSGWQHMDYPRCCPLFDDHTVLRASPRNWAEIMVEAWGIGKEKDWVRSVPRECRLKLPRDAKQISPEGVIRFPDTETA